MRKPTYLRYRRVLKITKVVRRGRLFLPNVYEVTRVKAETENLRMEMSMEDGLARASSLQLSGISD